MMQIKILEIKKIRKIEKMKKKIFVREIKTKKKNHITFFKNDKNMINLMRKK